MLLIIAAAALETALLRAQIRSQKIEQFSRYQLFSGTLQQQPILLAHSGLGQSAMAMQLTRLLENYPVCAVLLCGCGGSYPASRLQNGDLAIASEEIYGDLGVMTAERFITLEELEIPQVPELMPSSRQRYPLQSELTEFACEALPAARFGPFVTVSSCSGNAQLSEQLQQRTGGICENMEGAAAAQVCAEYRLPLLELRGISNPTGTRDPEQWQLKKGAEAAQRGIMEILQHWPQQQD